MGRDKTGRAYGTGQGGEEAHVFCKRKTRLTGKNVAVKTERLFFYGRKTERLFSGNRPFFRGPENRATVFRTVFLRKTGKTVIFKVKKDDTPLFFFFRSYKERPNWVYF